MRIRFQTSAAALAIGASLTATAPAMAQSANGVVPLCENPQGRLWNDIVNPKMYEKLPGYEEPEADGGMGLGGLDVAALDGPPCLIEFDGLDLYVSGRLNAQGKVVVQKGDVLDAAERTGIRLPNKQQQAATQPEADQGGQAQTTPENKPADQQAGDGSLIEMIQEQASQQATIQPEAQPEVRQDDTEESTQAANQTAEAQAASGDNTGRDESVEVETQTVTEADARSSDQDFSNSANAQVVENDDGLSNFEKFALGALGAVAAGQILDNGSKVVANSGDRVVVQRQDGEYEVLKDDNVLLRRPGTEVTTERFSDGSTRETLTRPNGAQIVTVKTADGQVLKRLRVMPNGREVILFDDTEQVEPVVVSELPRENNRSVEIDATDADQLRAALAGAEAREIDRRFSLQQIRQIRAVRELVPVIELEAINFETNSSAIRPTEAEELRDLGVAMQRLIERNPYEVFLVEGHTDAVGSASYNLALSDRRAESVALALTEYFDVPPENMVVQGYGESNLKERTLEASRENRRATVRRITPLLRNAALD